MRLSFFVVMFVYDRRSRSLNSFIFSTWVFDVILTMECSGGSRIFMMWGDSGRLGALHWRRLGTIMIIKRSISLFFSLFCWKKPKIFFWTRGDRPHCPPLNPPLVAACKIYRETTWSTSSLDYSMVNMRKKSIVSYENTHVYRETKLNYFLEKAFVLS